jgi:hypothetical protein
LQWSAKLNGQFIRLAALMALAADAGATTVDSDSAMRAVVLTDYFVDHARAALALAGADGPMAGARAVAVWIKARRERTFTRRDCHRAFEHRFPTVAELQVVIDLLAEYGYLREGESTPTGGRRATVYDVNPAVWA